MMIGFFLAVFSLSLVGIVGLFSLAYVEGRIGRPFLSGAQHSLDTVALTVRRLLKRVVFVIEHLPELSVQAFYALVHLFVVLVALAARAIEAWAHRAADTVSYKRDFKQRPTRSSFLRQVRHHKETLQVPDEVLGGEEDK